MRYGKVVGKGIIRFLFTHLCFERLLRLIELNEPGVLLAHQRLEVRGVAGGLVGAVVGQLQLAGDVVVVGGDRLELVLQLGLDL